MIKKILFSAIILGLIASACENTNKENKNKEAVEKQEETVVVPEFSKDTAFYYVAKQVEFGPRVPGTEAHEKCAEFLAKRLNEYGHSVTIQDITVRIYNGKILKGKNIIASCNPDNQQRVMLSAHWDSRPYADNDPDPSNHNKAIPGANDGASGVGVLMEIARLISQTPPKIGIDIVFWDIEDYGTPKNMQDQSNDTWGLGSQYWSKNKHIPTYNAKYGILLDMVGVKNATYRIEGFSQRYAPSIVRKVWKHAADLGYSKTFIDNESNPIMDDHYYINMYANIPTIDIIHQDDKTGTGFYPYWHTMQDDIDKIDPDMLEIVGKVVTKTIYSEK